MEGKLHLTLMMSTNKVRKSNGVRSLDNCHNDCLRQESPVCAKITEWVNYCLMSNRIFT